MDLEELKAWAAMLDVELTTLYQGCWRVYKYDRVHYVWEDQSADKWLAAIKFVARIPDDED